MKHFLNAALAIVLVLGLISGCSQLEDPLELEQLHIPTITPLTSASPPIGPTEVVRLIAAQTEDVGTVTCWITGDFLFIEYATKDGWSLAETHLAVAEFLSDIPSTPSGNPKVGHFPLKNEHQPFTTVHADSLNMDDWGFGEAEELYIAAHGDVQVLSGEGAVMREEGAWGEGESFVLNVSVDPHQVERPAGPSKDGTAEIPDNPGRGNWATYFKVNVKKLKGLILWNKLGSVHEVTHSRVGPDGIIVGDIEYLLCRHGYGFRPLTRTGDPNIPDNYITFSGLDLGPQGCIEFWYHPDWIDWRVGHVVTMFVYGLYNDSSNSYLEMGYNDWQELFGGNTRGPVYSYSISKARRPATIPGWSTTESFHIAMMWDATRADISERFIIFINGEEMIPTRFVYSGNPDFSGWSPEAVFHLGSRVTTGDWYRHHWEGSEGIIDNIKIWSYPKTDFSDRFVE